MHFKRILFLISALFTAQGLYSAIYEAKSRVRTLPGNKEQYVHFLSAHSYLQADRQDQIRELQAVKQNNKNTYVIGSNKAGQYLGVECFDYMSLLRKAFDEAQDLAQKNPQDIIALWKHWDELSIKDFKDSFGKSSLEEILPNEQNENLKRYYAALLNKLGVFFIEYSIEDQGVLTVSGLPAYRSENIPYNGKRLSFIDFASTLADERLVADFINKIYTAQPKIDHVLVVAEDRIITMVIEKLEKLSLGYTQSHVGQTFICLYTSQDDALTIADYIKQFDQQKNKQKSSVRRPIIIGDRSFLLPYLLPWIFVGAYAIYSYRTFIGQLLFGSPQSSMPALPSLLRGEPASAPQRLA